MNPLQIFRLLEIFGESAFAADWLRQKFGETQPEKLTSWSCDPETQEEICEELLDELDWRF